MSSLNIRLRILYTFLLQPTAIKVLVPFHVNNYKNYFNKDLSAHTQVFLSSSKTTTNNIIIILIIIIKVLC